MLGIVSHGLNGKLKGYEIAEDCAKQCKSPHPFPLLYDFSYYPYPLINMSMIPFRLIKLNKYRNHYYHYFISCLIEISPKLSKQKSFPTLARKI